MPSSRRQYLAACSTVVAATAGCTAFTQDSQIYQLVGGVEWKLLRGLRSGRLEKIATNQPESGGTVQHAAPVDMKLRTVSHDEAVIDLAGTGPLKLSSAQIKQIKKSYDEPYGAVVLTVYNKDPINDVPLGNSHGYKTTLTQFNQIIPGDRVTMTLAKEDDSAEADKIVHVERTKYAE